MLLPYCYKKKHDYALSNIGKLIFPVCFYCFLARFRALKSQSCPFLRKTTIERRVFAKIIKNGLKNGLCLEMISAFNKC
jgi:hypothetical protein